MILYHSSTSDDSIKGGQQECRSFGLEQDIRLEYDNDIFSDDRGEKIHHRRSSNGYSQLAPIALFVLSSMQVGCEPQDAPIIIPAVASFASLGLQHWLFCFWMGILAYQLCGIAQVGSALYYNNLAGSIQNYYLSYRGRPSHYSCYDYKDLRLPIASNSTARGTPNNF